MVLWRVHRCGLLLDFNHPANHLFRSRGTAYKVDEPILNMAGVYVRKATSESSRWGMEFTLQGGQDSRIFGFSATAPNMAGAEWLRHLGPTDVSYFAPLGKGLTVHRIDYSRGSAGGFFRGGKIAHEVVGLTPTQNFLTLGVIVSLDSHLGPRSGRSENHDGPCIRCSDHSVRHFGHSLRPCVRKAERNQVVSLENALLLSVCALLIGYLLYALLKAEEF